MTTIPRTARKLRKPTETIDQQKATNEQEAKIKADNNQKYRK